MAPCGPAGFAYQPDALSGAEERAWVKKLEALPFKPFEFHGYLGKPSGLIRIDLEWDADQRMFIGEIPPKRA